MWERLTSKGQLKLRLYQQNSCSIIWSLISSHVSPFFFFFFNSPLLTLNKDPAVVAEIALFSPLPFISASVSHNLHLDRDGHKGRHALTQGGIIRGVSDDRKALGFTSIQRGVFPTHTVNVSKWKQSSLYVSPWLSVWISIRAERAPGWEPSLFGFFWSIFIKQTNKKTHKKKQKKHERWWKWRLISRRVSITLRKWPWRWKSPPPPRWVPWAAFMWGDGCESSVFAHTHT